MIRQPSLIVLLLSYLPALAGEPRVTGIRAEHRHGQTFVTWKEAAQGDESANYRYMLLRSDAPITQKNHEAAEVVARGILHQSGRLFGHVFNGKDRLDPKKPMATIVEGGAPLPAGTGVAVHTVRKPGKHFYAVLATDVKDSPATKIVPAESATTMPVAEVAAPMQPIKLYDSHKRGIYSPQTSLTGTKGLLLQVELHASQGQGGGAGDYGDYYLYFANSDMGYRDGLPGVFSVEERRAKTGNYLVLRSRDAIERPSATGAMETYWFGYLFQPVGAQEPRAYPFTENRMRWIIDWVVRKYDADPKRITAGGGSMGAWGSMTFAFRQTDLFAAVYPNRPRTQQRALPSLAGPVAKGKKVLLADGVTDYFERMDMVKFALDHEEDLPFVGWCCGRRDGFATWQEQVDLARALATRRHGFAFAWNNGDHSSGAEPMRHILKYYAPDKFARGQSYPAFSNSSLDQDPGKGPPTEGDLEGGINLGFAWKDVVDEPGQWSLQVANDLAKNDMTVDITPRRLQKFAVKPGEKLRWTTSTGDSGTVEADRRGLVTIARVKIAPGRETSLKITRA